MDEPRKSDLTMPETNMPESNTPASNTPETNLPESNLPEEPKGLPQARPYLGGGGGMMPVGEGPKVVGTDQGMALVQEHPEDIPGESPDWERSPSRGGWQY